MKIPFNIRELTATLFLIFLTGCEDGVWDFAPDATRDFYDPSDNYEYASFISTNGHLVPEKVMFEDGKIFVLLPGETDVMDITDELGHSIHGFEGTHPEDPTVSITIEPVEDTVTITVEDKEAIVLIYTPSEEHRKSRKRKRKSMAGRKRGWSY